MIIFIVTQGMDWGKGKTLSEAVKNLPNKFYKSSNFGLYIYDVENYENINVTDYGDINRGKNDKKLYGSAEKL